LIRPLSENDDPSGFSCGSRELDSYLRRHALPNSRAGVSATHVFVDETGRILGYVTLAATSVRATELPTYSPSLGLPGFPLPALLIARLAVDTSSRRRGLGTDLVGFAMAEALVLHARVGCVGVMVDAKKSAVGFYARAGFTPTEQAEPEPRYTRMFMPIGTVADALRQT